MNNKEQEGLGNYIRLAREARGWTQQVLADRAGWPGRRGQTRVCQLETKARGAKRVNINDVITLADALGLPPEVLLFGEKSRLLGQVRDLPVLANEGLARNNIKNKRDLYKVIMASQEKMPVPTVIRAGARAFVYRVESLNNGFRLGDTLIVDPDVQPIAGHHVLAIVGDQGPAVYQYKQLERKKDVLILGVVAARIENML